MKRTGRKILVLFIVSINGIIACKKSPVLTEDKPVSPTTGTRLQFTLDSIYLYAKQAYLWNDILPDYQTYNPRQYTDQGSELLNLQKNLFRITQYQLNPATGKPFESTGLSGTPKYSYITATGNTSGQIAGVNTEGRGNDFGMEVASAGSDLYVSMVYPSSPAATSGLQRGDHILFINNLPATGGMALEALTAQSIRLLIQKNNGIQLTAQLNKTSYASQPVLKTTLISTTQQNMGYLALSQFNHLNTSKTALDQAFEKFSAAGITDLIIDLRYNAGGYVETARYLANLIASATLNGKTMYAEHFNTQLQQGKATILKNQPYTDANGNPVYLNNRRATYADVDFSVSGNTYNFDKSGSLQTVKNIYFIVSRQTASASELLINVLKPYYNIKIAGAQTYGKPVGFFGIKIDQYTVYLSSFLIKNALGFSDYFEGFTPDILVADDVKHDFGDEQELSLKAILDYARTGSTAAKHITPTNPVILKKDFSGMINQRLQLKKQ